MNELMKVLAVIFLYREKYWSDQKRFDAAVAYATAYDMLCYALGERKDCLCQFDGFEEAIDFLKAHPTCAPEEFEEIFKGQF